MSSAESPVEHDDIPWMGLVIQVGISAGLGALALLVFSTLRPRYGSIYARRESCLEQEKRPSEVSTGILAWIPPLWSIKDADLASKVGFDAVMFIVFLRFSTCLFLFLSLIVATILIPINIFSGRASPQPFSFSLDLISITKASFSPNNLWAHVAISWFISLTMYLFVIGMNNAFRTMRQRFLREQDLVGDAAIRSFILTSLPESLRNTETMSLYLRARSVNTENTFFSVARHLDALPELIDQHASVTESLDKIFATYFKNSNSLPKNRPMTRHSGIFSSKVDAIDFYTGEKERLVQEISLKRDRVKAYRASSVGFVTFPSIHAAHAAYSLLQKPATRGIVKMFGAAPSVRLAPSSEDIIWTNARIPRFIRRGKWISGWALYVLITVLSVPIVMGVSTLANMNLLRSTFEWARDFAMASPLTFAVISSTAAPLCMAIFLQILPYIFRLITHYQGVRTHSEQSLRVMRMTLAFLVLNSFLFILASLSTTLFNTLPVDQTLQSAHPLTTEPTTMERAAASMVSASTFWINFILLRTLSVLVELSQIPRLLLGLIRSWGGRMTPRERKAFLRPLDTEFPLLYSAHIFVFSVALMYSVIAPLILPFALLYFALSLMAHKYGIMFVRRTKYESGGRAWPSILHILLLSLFLFQLIMIGVFILSNGGGWSFAVIPCPVITVLLWVLYIPPRLRTYRFIDPPRFPEPKINSTPRPNDEGVGEEYTQEAMVTPLPVVVVSSQVALRLRTVYKGAFSLEDSEIIVPALPDQSDLFSEPRGSLNFGKPSAEEMQWLTRIREGEFI